MRKTYHLFLTTTAALGLAAALASGTTAFAAEAAQPAGADAAPAADPATSPAAAQGDDIVVSARRVNERLQDVPVAVTAVSSATLRDLNIRTPQQLNGVVPNVAMTRIGGSPTGNVAYIRGIGTGDPNVALEPPVATYIDGVYIGRMTASNIEIADVERVEVLRGPQGTLFGRNTTGGAISIVTKTPQRDFGFEQRLTVAEGGEFISRSRVSTGQIANTGLSATVAYLHRQRRGTMDSPNLQSDRDPGSMSLDSVWGRVHGEWGAITADYSFDLMDGKFENDAMQLITATPTFLGVFGASAGLGGTPLPYGPNGKLENQNVLATDPIAIHTLGHSLTLNARLSDALSIKSISAFRKYTRDGATPYGPDGLLIRSSTGTTIPAVIFRSRPNQWQNQYSEELQAYGSAGEFSYIGGLYYFRERTGEDGKSSGTLLRGTGTVGDPYYGIPYDSFSLFSLTSTSKAAFGQVNWKPGFANGALELAAGIRYSHDRKVIAQLKSTARNGDASFDNTSYNFTASYKVMPDVMLFGRIGTGYRAGGFNTRAASTATFNQFYFAPETSNIYELGLKSEFLDHKVRFNLTGFYNKYKNLQVSRFTGSTPDGTVGDVLSANATYRGFEAELTVRPTAGLTLYSNVGYTKAKYSEIYFPNPTTGVLQNYADQAFFAYQPKWTVANGIAYSAPVGLGELRARLDHVYTSARVFAATPTAIAPWTDVLRDPGHSVFNARIALSEIPLGPTKGEIALWGDNIFNKKYLIQATDFGVASSSGFGMGFYAEGARFGADFTIKF